MPPRICFVNVSIDNSYNAGHTAHHACSRGLLEHRVLQTLLQVTFSFFAPVRQRTSSDSLLPFIKSSIPRSELVQSLPFLSSEIPSLKSALTRDVNARQKQSWRKQMVKMRGFFSFKFLIDFLDNGTVNDSLWKKIFKSGAAEL